ncbi:MAG: PCRF domain-containing protein, partial [Oscillospiraceae bacterium]|nr:PCRF domain-containing protein [Oscillospiraceae bacterium]
MLDKLKAVELKFTQIQAQLAAPETYAAPALAAKLNREASQLEPVVDTYRAYCATQQAVQDALELLSDPEMKELAQEELRQAKADLERLEQQLRILLLPRDPNDEKNVIVEIRAGVGGEEAALFALSLYRMYSMYAERC